MLTDADTNIMETCFHNGERHMKDKVISTLNEIKGRIGRPSYANIDDIIKVVEVL